MNLTVLGNNGPYPAPSGACSGYLLESDSGDTRILMECGAGSLANLFRECPPQALTGIVLSHLHYDHVSDMLPMQYYLQWNPPKRNIPVLCPEEPQMIRTLLACPSLDLIPPEDMVLGEMALSFIPARHPVPGVCVSAVCDGQRFVFTGDTNDTPLLELFADGCDLLLADAGLPAAEWSQDRAHLSARMCGELATRARAKRLLLTHLCPKDDPDELLSEAALAYPGAELAVIGRHYGL